MNKLTYYQLGHWGQLGAQFMQVSATLSLAWKHQMIPVIDNQWQPRHMLSIPDEHFDVPTGQAAWELWHNSGSFLPQYLHDFQLIADYVETLQQYFQPSALAQEIIEPLQNRYATSERVSVHLRRGDYVNETNRLIFTQLGASYYTPMPSNALIFTNDIDYAHATYPNVECVQPNAPIVDLLLMASCGAHVIANSSFSWFAAFISNNSTKFPLPYYTAQSGYPTQEDFCLPHWVPVWVNQ